MSDRRIYIGSVIDAFEECLRAFIRGQMVHAIAWHRVGCYRLMSADRLISPPLEVELP